MSDSEDFNFDDDIDIDELLDATLGPSPSQPPANTAPVSTPPLPTPREMQPVPTYPSTNVDDESDLDLSDIFDDDEDQNNTASSPANAAVTATAPSVVPTTTTTASATTPTTAPSSAVAVVEEGTKVDQRDDMTEQQPDEGQYEEDVYEEEEYYEDEEEVEVDTDANAHTNAEVEVEVELELETETEDEGFPVEGTSPASNATNVSAAPTTSPSAASTTDADAVKTVVPVSETLAEAEADVETEVEVQAEHVADDIVTDAAVDIADDYVQTATTPDADIYPEDAYTGDARVEDVPAEDVYVEEGQAGDKDVEGTYVDVEYEEDAYEEEGVHDVQEAVAMEEDCGKEEEKGMYEKNETADKEPETNVEPEVDAELEGDKAGEVAGVDDFDDLDLSLDLDVSLGLDSSLGLESGTGATGANTGTSAYMSSIAEAEEEEEVGRGVNAVSQHVDVNAKDTAKRGAKMQEGMASEKHNEQQEEGEAWEEAEEEESAFDAALEAATDAVFGAVDVALGVHTYDSLTAEEEKEREEEQRAEAQVNVEGEYDKEEEAAYQQDATYQEEEGAYDGEDAMYQGEGAEQYMTEGADVDADGAYMEEEGQYYEDGDESQYAEQQQEAEEVEAAAQEEVEGEVDVEGYYQEEEQEQGHYYEEEEQGDGIYQDQQDQYPQEYQYDEDEVAGDGQEEYAENVEELEGEERVDEVEEEVEPEPELTLPQFVSCALADYTRLRVLRLHACELESVPSDLPRTLEELDLSHNFITSLEPLAHLTKLTVLNLTNNCLTSLKSMPRLHNLVELKLNYNHITNVSGLGVLVRLAMLDLSNTQIATAASLRPLSLNTYLRLLWLRDTPLMQSKGFSRPVIGNLLPHLCQLDGASLETFSLVMPLFNVPTQVGDGKKRGKPQLLIGACAKHVPCEEETSRVVRSLTLEGEWNDEVFGDRDIVSANHGSHMRHRPLYPATLDVSDARREWCEYEPLLLRLYNRYSAPSAVKASVATGRGSYIKGSHSMNSVVTGSTSFATTNNAPGAAGSKSPRVMEFQQFVRFLRDYHISPHFVLDNHTCLLLQLIEGSLLFRNKGINITFETFVMYFARLSLYYAWICYERQYPPPVDPSRPESERGHPARILTIGDENANTNSNTNGMGLGAGVGNVNTELRGEDISGPKLYEWSSHKDVRYRCLPPEFLCGCVHLIAAALTDARQQQRQQIESTTTRFSSLHDVHLQKAHEQKKVPVKVEKTPIAPFRTGRARLENLTHNYTYSSTLSRSNSTLSSAVNTPRGGRSTSRTPRSGRRESSQRSTSTSRGGRGRGFGESGDYSNAEVDQLRGLFGDDLHDDYGQAMVGQGVMESTMLEQGGRGQRVGRKGDRNRHERGLRQPSTSASSYTSRPASAGMGTGVGVDTAVDMGVRQAWAQASEAEWEEYGDPAAYDAPVPAPTYTHAHASVSAQVVVPTPSPVPTTPTAAPGYMFSPTTSMPTSSTAATAEPLTARGVEAAVEVDPASGLPMSLCTYVREIEEEASSVVLLLDNLVSVLRDAPDNATLETQVIELCEIIEQMSLLQPTEANHAHMTTLQQYGRVDVVVAISDRIAFMENVKGKIAEVLEQLEANNFDTEVSGALIHAVLGDDGGEVWLQTPEAIAL